MKQFRWLGLFAGLGLFAWILSTQNLSEVWKQVWNLQWRFVWVAFFYAVIFGLDTLGWRCALAGNHPRKVRWDQLFRVRLAGEAINYVTPTAWIGGEPVKAYLLSKRYGIPTADGMASVVIAKTTFSISMFLFILTGIAVALATQGIRPEISRWVWILLPVLGVLLGLFLAVQFLKPFQQSQSALARIIPGWMRKLEDKVQGWDETLLGFYRKSPQAVFFSFFFHFLGWIAGIFEVFLILRLLGIPVSWTTAWSIECLWVLLKTGAFLIPASIGASEGLAILVCTGFGLTSVAGLALALIRRAREILWVGLGLVEFYRN